MSVGEKMALLRELSFSCYRKLWKRTMVQKFRLGLIQKRILYILIIEKKREY